MGRELLYLKTSKMSNEVPLRKGEVEKVESGKWNLCTMRLKALVLFVHYLGIVLMGSKMRE